VAFGGCPADHPRTNYHRAQEDTTMSGETVITVIGNLTRDPEVGFTSNGTAYARFTIASTPRRYDPNASEWTDGEALFLRCTAWRQLAENVGESLTKGARVVVSGRLRLHTWQTDDGETRSSTEVDVEEVGPSLRYATAKVAKTTRPQGRQPEPAGDSWAGRQPASAGAARSGGHPGEPPF
jgi:single-strand DNA-binding protein